LRPHRTLCFSSFTPLITICFCAPVTALPTKSLTLKHLALGIGKESFLMQICIKSKALARTRAKHIVEGFERIGPYYLHQAENKKARLGSLRTGLTVIGISTLDPVT